MEVIDNNMKTIFMTGATSGLGKAAAAKLANDGAKLIVLVRNTIKGAELNAYYKNNWPEGKGVIEVVEGNLNSFKSIELACNEVREKV